MGRVSRELEVDVAYAAERVAAVASVLALRPFDEAAVAAHPDRQHRTVAKQRPEMAARIVFLAEASSVAQAPPSSAIGRVLPRPVEIATVRELLERTRRTP